MTTKIDKLFNAFVKGRSLTAEQITSSFGLANPRAAVSTLRLRRNLDVELVKTKTGITKYKAVNA